MKRQFDKLEAEKLAIAAAQAEKPQVDNSSDYDDYLNILEEGEGDLQQEEVKAVHQTQTDWITEDSPVNFETNFYVREQYVLAHSNNIDIITNNNFLGE